VSVVVAALHKYKNTAFASRADRPTVHLLNNILPVPGVVQLISRRFHTNKLLTTQSQTCIMVNVKEAFSLVLVGAFWGCTNPFMRKGFVDTKSTTDPTNTTTTKNDTTDGTLQFIITKLVHLANIKIWLPYVINQLGSVLFYKTLASSNLTLSVPICNATAMVFSSITSAILGEKVDKPWRAVSGVICVLLGVAVCIHSSNDEEVVVVTDGVNEL
jgi:hypothetical protein